MPRTENPRVFLSNGDQNEKPLSYDDLVSHFRSMGLDTSGLTLGWIGFAEFEIIEQNGLVKIDVDRADGTLTRCYLSHSLAEDRHVYLQIDSGFNPYDPDSQDKDIHGIFPGRIVGISSSLHSGNGVFTSLNFKTEKGYLGVTEHGTIIMASD